MSPAVPGRADPPSATMCRISPFRMPWPVRRASSWSP